MEYKGYNIKVKKDNGANQNYAYVAYIIDAFGAKEHTRGCSEEDAISFLKQRIDNYPTYKSMYIVPLSEIELENLIKYVRSNYFAIARRLKTRHYILPNDFD